MNTVADFSATPPVAIVFPGQGSQAVGMCAEWIAQAPENSPVAGLYELVDRLAEAPIRHYTLAGPDDVLRQTRITQPAIVAASVVAWWMLAEAFPWTPRAMAGHSLGEYTALYAAGVLSLEDTLRLVVQRARLMETAPAGSMSAVLGLAETQVEKAVLRAQGEGLGPIGIANYNTGDQYVIAGSQAAVARATEILKEEGARRVLPLPVSGAFHSALMDDAADAFASVLNTASFSDARCPIVTNVDAQWTQHGADLLGKLAYQINHPVRWIHTMERLFVDGQIKVLIEVGPGAVLGNMAKKMYKDITILRVSDPASLQETLASLKEMAFLSAPPQAAAAVPG
jgi:[acyl-carrier-protein] S-malonyltransferase